jgi:hypothetical protein
VTKWTHRAVKLLQRRNKRRLGLSARVLGAEERLDATAVGQLLHIKLRPAIGVSHGSQTLHSHGVRHLARLICQSFVKHASQQPQDFCAAAEGGKTHNGQTKSRQKGEDLVS